MSSSLPVEARGFSLVELLVGVAIALIGIVMMFQVVHDWEGRKRTTASGSDAQVAGSIAIFTLERDIRMAGYGFGASAAMGCDVSGYDSVRGGAIPAFPMVPALITDGANGAPDSLTVLYGNGTTVSARIYNSSTATTKIADNPDGLKPGDLFIAADTATPPNCGLFETTASPAGIGAVISHANGNYTNYGGVPVAARYNNGNAMGLGFGPGTLFNLGTAPQLNVWGISAPNPDSANRILSVTNVIANQSARDIAEGVVNLQAEYGTDTTGDGVVDAWAASAPAPGDWRKVLAIRVALLARSQQYEARTVTLAPPTWAGGVPFVMRNVDGTADDDPANPNNWRRYTYRVYEAVIPLRNVVWGSLP